MHYGLDVKCRCPGLAELEVGSSSVNVNVHTPSNFSSAFVYIWFIFPPPVQTSFMDEPWLIDWEERLRNNLFWIGLAVEPKHCWCEMWPVFGDSGWLVCTCHSCLSSAASSVCGSKACRSASCLWSCRRPTSCWSSVSTSTWYVSVVSCGWRKNCSLSYYSFIALQRRLSKSPSRRLTENPTDIYRCGHMCLQLLYVHTVLSIVGVCSQVDVNSRVMM